MGTRSVENCINDAIELGWTFVPLPFSKFFGESSYNDLIAVIYGEEFDGKFTTGFFVYSHDGLIDGTWGLAFEFDYDATTFALKYKF